MDHLIASNCSVKLVIWTNLYESPLAGAGSAEKARIRNEASKQLRHQSPVYYKKGCFRYSAGHNKQGYPWTQSNLSTKVTSRITGDIDKTLPSIETNQRPLSKYVTEKTIPELPKVAKEPESEKSSNHVIMLRRPTTMVPPPILVSEDSFKSLTNSTRLRSIIIKESQAKTFEFYRTHYPLLLEKSIGEDRDKIFNKRNIIRDTPEQVAQKRSKYVHERLEGLHRDLKNLEDEMTDGKFRTELRRKIYDPRVWLWNKKRYIQPVDFYDD